MTRAAVALLFVLSVLAAATVGDEDRDPRPVASAPVTTTSSTTTTIELPTLTTTSTTVAPPATLPPPPPGEAKVVVSHTGVVLPVAAVDGNAFRVTTPCGNTATVGGTPVPSAAVVLDAGHGGAEPGAVGPNGLTEKVLNLAVVQHAKAALERAGLTVVLTRTGDHRLPLEARARIVKALQPKAFVSVHHNAEPDGPFPKPGSETYYQTASAESKRLAGLLYEEIVQALSQYQVAWVADTDAGAKYRKSDSGDDYYGILRRTQGTPASLAELAFVSNPPEAELLTRPDVQQVEGEAVARGIVRFLTTKDPGSGFTEPYPRTTPAGPGGGTRNCVDPPL
ncbi:MAG TPA: N-acetylmuramoyl-L-alanine amidase [Acidimicrobiales bacterium]|nr:N-acetylmuramoyl-L-alanine amidase [Acidimicrobiales bacterium]